MTHNTEYTMDRMMTQAAAGVQAAPPYATLLSQGVAPRSALDVVDYPPLHQVLGALESQVEQALTVVMSLHEPITHLFGPKGDPRFLAAVPSPSDEPSVQVVARLVALSNKLQVLQGYAQSASERLSGGL